MPLFAVQYLIAALDVLGDGRLELENVEGDMVPDPSGVYPLRDAACAMHPDGRFARPRP
ncbi:MAG: hypothetical protein ACPGUV_10990 [Polyangiales bacterium]